MAHLDLQPVDLPNGDRIYPQTICHVVFKSDKDLSDGEKSSDVDANFRKIFKTSQITLNPAGYKEVDYELETAHEEPLPLIGPNDRIIAKHKNDQEAAGTLEYDLDEEDRVWLDEANKTRERKKKKKISEDAFELAMDRLEKETYFKVLEHASSGHELASMDGSDYLDEDCCICHNGDVENTNQIIYCDMCNIAVHQDCYGVPYIPEGQWLCRKCKLSPMESVKCELCPLRDGAFKQTPDGKWAHVACAIWLNEVHFGNTAFLEPIEGVNESLRKRCKLRCLVCKVKMGACLQCSKGSCVRSFHVTCAMQARLQMTVSAEEDEKAQDGLTVRRFVYCHIHGSVAVGENEFAKNKRRAVEAIRRARRQMVTKAVSSRSAPVPYVDEEARERIDERVRDKDIVDEIMGFWFYKRKKRCGLPLIRRLQMVLLKAKMKSATPRPLTPRREMHFKGRIMFEKLRLVIEMKKKRELNVQEQMVASRAITEACFQDPDDVFVELIESMMKFDHLGFFSKDPLKQGLLNYSSVIKKPMDLSSMKNNAKKGLYKSAEDLKVHLDLIFNNCSMFNKGNVGVLVYAEGVREKMNKAYEDMVKYLEYVEMWGSQLGLTEESASRMEKELIGRDIELPIELELQEKEIEEMELWKYCEEGNSRKRKAEEPKIEDVERPAVKRDQRMREREKEKDKETNQPAVASVFAPSTLFTSPALIPRRFSFDSFNTRLDSNSNRSPRQQRLTRGQTQASFSGYRNICSVKSPEMGITSCDSAVESDGETSAPRNLRSSSSVHDMSSLQHGDLVKVDSGSRKMAGQILEIQGSIEDPKLLTLLREVEPNQILVKTFTNNSISRYDTSCVHRLNIESDSCEGIDEARKHYKLICSK